MRKAAVRIMAGLLTACLVLDSVTTVGFVGAGFHPRPRSDVNEMSIGIAGGHGGPPLQVFTEQALAEPFIDQGPIIPHPSVSKLAAAASLDLHPQPAGVSPPAPEERHLLPVIETFDAEPDARFALVVHPEGFEPGGRFKRFWNRIKNRFWLNHRQIPSVPFPGFDEFKIGVGDLVEQYQRTHPDMEVLAVLPNGNIGYNRWFMGVTGDVVYHNPADRFPLKDWEMLVELPGGKRQVMTLRSVRNPDGRLRLQDPSTEEDMTSRIVCAIHGPRILHNGEIDWESIAKHTDDLRHALRIPFWTGGGEFGGQLYLGFTDGEGELYRDRDKVLKALKGEPITLSLDPLTKRNILPEERDRALAAWGYQKMDPGSGATGRLERGYFVDETKNIITIRLSHGVSAHTVLGISEDGRPMVGAVKGLTNHQGATLPELALAMKARGAKEVYLWANGKDAYADVKGKEAVAADNAKSIAVEALLVVRPKTPRQAAGLPDNDVYWLGRARQFELDKEKDPQPLWLFDEVLGRLASKNARILEIACGSGRALQIFLQRGYHNILGTDLSQEALDLAKERGVPDRNLAQVNIRTDPLPGRFDLIWASDILLYLNPQELEASMSKMTAALDDHGQLVVRWAAGTDEVVNKGDRWVSLASEKFLRGLMARHGLTVTTMKMIDEPIYDGKAHCKYWYVVAEKRPVVIGMRGFGNFGVNLLDALLLVIEGLPVRVLALASNPAKVLATLQKRGRSTDQLDLRQTPSVNLDANPKLYYDICDEAFRDAAGVIFALPARYHGTVVEWALNAGLNVYTEKPFVLDAEKARWLVELARMQNRLLMVGHNLLYAPMYRRLKEIVADPAFGPVRRIEGTFLMKVPAEKKDKTANVLEDVATHHLYLADDLLGAGAASTLAGQVGWRDDRETVDLHGRMGTVEVDLSASRVFKGKAVRTFRVIGDRYAVTFDHTRDPNQLIVEAVGDDFDPETLMRLRKADEFEKEPERALVPEMRAFVQAILAGTPVLSPAEAAVPIVEAIERLGKVELPSTGLGPVLPQLHTSGDTWPGRLAALYPHLVEWLRIFAGQVPGPAPLVIVDIGIGDHGAPTTFELAAALRAAGFLNIHIYGVDDDPERVAEANRRLEKEHPGDGITIQFLEGGFDLESLGIKDAHLVLVSNVMRYYFDSRNEAEAALRGGLHDRGILVEAEGPDFGMMKVPGDNIQTSVFGKPGICLLHESIPQETGSARTMYWLKDLLFGDQISDENYRRCVAWLPEFIAAALVGVPAALALFPLFTGHRADFAAIAIGIGLAFVGEHFIDWIYKINAQHRGRIYPRTRSQLVANSGWAMVVAAVPTAAAVFLHWHVWVLAPIVGLIWLGWHAAVNLRWMPPPNLDRVTEGSA